MKKVSIYILMILLPCALKATNNLPEHSTLFKGRPFTGFLRNLKTNSGFLQNHSTGLFRGLDSTLYSYKKDWKAKTRAFTDYLPLTGGTLSGMLTIDGVDGFASGIQLQQSSMYRHLITAYADRNYPFTGSALQFKVANDPYGGNAAVMTLRGSGNVGIGTNTPSYTLDVNGTARFGFLKMYSYLNTPAGANHTIYFQGEPTGTNDDVIFDMSKAGGAYGSFEYRAGGVSRMYIGGGSLSPGGYGYFYIMPPAHFGIGTSAPTEKLSVEGNISANGNISAKKLIVTQTGWSDYVFNKEYKLRSLSALESFIKQNKHLPEVPSAKEVEEKGISVGDNQALLLRKIEELTLYMIRQQKQIDAQQNEIRV